jgi:curved DNA-binding protein CbpA
MHEYVGLLRKFDLGPEANMKVIKAAYRSAVKEVHPDLHDDSVDDKAAELFRALNERYERILELRKSLGYPEN